MPYHVYILYSSQADQYYIGSTEKMADRLFRHKNAGSKSTKKAKDWELKYTRAYETRSEAVKAEHLIKA